MDIRILLNVPLPPPPDPLPPTTPWIGVLLSRVVTYLMWAVGISMVILAFRLCLGL